MDRSLNILITVLLIIGTVGGYLIGLNAGKHCKTHIKTVTSAGEVQEITVINDSLTLIPCKARYITK
jgi:hypothetical protein